jgi:small neutral amino acid transporter SnatA (MarC family)
MIPSVINLTIQNAQGFRLRLWLPVFIAWPIFLVLFLLLLPFLVLAEIILRIANVNIYLFAMLGGVFSLFSAMRGLTVKVNSVKQNSIVNVTIL